jgi:hypothetical protein
LVSPYSILIPDREKDREKMKYLNILGGLVLTLAVGRVPMAQAGTNCEDLLDNNAYFCQVTPEIGSDFTFGD